ncbi:MAG: hypothetical protein ACLP1Q_13070 [Solirubrobacteraceae bacterium]
MSDATQPQPDFAFDSMLRAQERPLIESAKDAQAIDKLMGRPAPKKRPLPPPLPLK